jgi:serine/threonine-protein kinase HipA
VTRDPLDVWLYGRHVAHVHDAGFGDTSVAYSHAAVDQPVGAALSLSLPVRRDRYPTAGPGGRWVRSLLPEGRALDWAVTEFAIPADDKFGLISVLGRDVAGAVQIVEAGESPDAAGHYEPLTDDETISVVDRAHDTPLGLNRARRVRLSLAGMQDKILLHRDVDGWHRPVDGASSTVIIKPQPRPSGNRDYPGLTTNELYCLTLADACGIPAARATVERFGELEALVVERYDRTVTPAGVTRIHQEDFLGALGLDPLIKYEYGTSELLSAAGGWASQPAAARRGPSLADLADLVSATMGKARLVEFAARVLFNVIVGNADAHARNYSVLLHPDGTVSQTPLYDVVCTLLYPDLDTDHAQRIAGVCELDAVTYHDLVAEQGSWGVPPTTAARRTTQLIERIAASTDQGAERCVAAGGDPAVTDRVAHLIKRRCRQLLDRRAGRA